MNAGRFFASHPRLASWVRKRFWNQLSTVCYTRFVIRFQGGTIPEFSLGPPGRELACYIPDGFEWRQVNYGQWEGQADIEGREWGFYFEHPGELTVVLHHGEIGLEEAAFVRGVATRLATHPSGFELRLRGYTQPGNEKPGRS